MSNKTGIAWTESTWNPVTGCTKVSAGCKHCYAERDWRRLAAASHTVYAGRAFTDVRVHPERLDQPLRWKRPRRIFVNSMSDLFHEAVPDAAIDAILAVMLLAPTTPSRYSPSARSGCARILLRLTSTIGCWPRRTRNFLSRNRPTNSTEEPPRIIRMM